MKEVLTFFFYISSSLGVGLIQSMKTCLEVKQRQCVRLWYEKKETAPSRTPILKPIPTFFKLSLTPLYFTHILFSFTSSRFFLSQTVLRPISYASNRQSKTFLRRKGIEFAHIRKISSIWKFHVLQNQFHTQTVRQYKYNKNSIFSRLNAVKLLETNL